MGTWCRSVFSRRGFTYCRAPAVASLSWAPAGTGNVEGCGPASVGEAGITNYLFSCYAGLFENFILHSVRLTWLAGWLAG